MALVIFDSSLDGSDSTVIIRPEAIKISINKTNENLSIIRQLVSILKPERVESFESWIRLGWCLHNIDHRLLEDWVEFSKQSEKFVDGECEKEWGNMKNEGLGLGSLFLWAKEDNVEKYMELSINYDFMRPWSFRYSS